MLLWYVVLCLLINKAWTDNTLNNTESVDNKEDDDDSYFPTPEWSDIFDWKLIKVLSDESENVLVSPLSLKIVLALLYDGSSGSTQREFEAGLQFLTKQGMRTELKKTLDKLHVQRSSENKLLVSTGLFLDSKITPKEKYAKNIQEYYKTDIVKANFSDTDKASYDINDWGYRATQGKVSQLVSPDDLEYMIMLIANAVYFKGIWRHQFPENETCVSEFYVTPENVYYVPFMTTTDLFYYMESETLDARILRLPYKNSEFSMFIVLPLSKAGLPSLIERISLSNLHQQLHYMNKRAIQVSIPKFQFKFKSSYVKILQQFGLHKMFQNTASFPGIAEGNSSILRQIVVSDIIQTAGIEVDEEGSVAYAATDVVIGNKIGVPDVIFNATHPFLFFIQEETNGTIIFIGKVENPVIQEAEIKKEKDDIGKEFVTTARNLKLRHGFRIRDN